MRYLCQVRHCGYVAIATIAVGPVSFLVCDLHDAWQVRRMLERSEAPAAYWSRGVPIVLPEGDLVARAPREAPAGAILATECQDLEEVKDGPHALLDEFDLTVGR
jgi:hypothetical protein